MKDASIAVVFFDDKVLLIKRRDVPIWVLPGGGIEEGESPEEALIREVKEETGLDVQIVRKVGLWLPLNQLSSCANVFECSLRSPPTGPLEPQEESSKVGFFPLEALAQPLFFMHRIWLDKALERRVSPIVTMMYELTYWNCIKLVFKHPIFAFRYLLSRIGIPLNS